MSRAAGSTSVPDNLHPSKFYGSSNATTGDNSENARVECIFCHKSSFVAKSFHSTKAAGHLVKCSLFEQQSPATYEEFCEIYDERVGSFQTKR